MSIAIPSETGASNGSNASEGASPGGMSPYARGGGGVTLERRVAALYLARLLVGDGAVELGDGRRVVSVEFQQAPSHPVDDLVVRAAHSDEPEPSLVIALAVRRRPRLIASDGSAKKLIRTFIGALIEAPSDGPQHRFGLVVAGPQTHAEQLGELAGLAADQMDAPGFFRLVHTPSAFNRDIRGRLDQLEGLVKHALVALGEAELGKALIRQRTWQLLSSLTVLMPRVESPDEKDWADVANSLLPVVRDRDLTAAVALRDRLFDLAGEYSSRSARIDLALLRRRVHEMLEASARRHYRGWQRLDHLHERALASVSGEIVASDGRRLRVDRSDEAGTLMEAASSAQAVVVTGESGVGKSALVLLSLTAAAAADPDTVEVLCINLRHIFELTVELEGVLHASLSALLCDLSAPHRMLVVDGADAVVEGREDAFGHLVDSARASNVKVIAVCADDTSQIVYDTLAARLGTDVRKHPVPSLTDIEIDRIAETFTELSSLNADRRSRELLRRLVVVDLLVRGRVSSVPLTEADAMNEVWSGLVRRQGRSDRGSPDARESTLLQLARQVLGGGDRLNAMAGIDSVALDGLRSDGLLRTSPDDPFLIGPEFAHDEVRRYAVARLLLADRDPAKVILEAGAPRWALAAARVACQALLAEPESAVAPVRGRLMTLQASFDALVEVGHGERWGDVPGEALLTLPDPDEILGGAWPDLSPRGPYGRPRLARIVGQRHRDDNRLIKVAAVEPIITLLLEDSTPWWSGEYAQELLRDWLHAHVVAGTAAGHRLRVRLRRRLVDACAEADRRLADHSGTTTASAALTAEELEQALSFMLSQAEVSNDPQASEEIEPRAPENAPSPVPEIGYGGRRRRERPEVPLEITDEIVLELLALLGPDLGDSGEAILHRVAQDAPWELAPALEEPLAPWALANYGRALLAELTEAYYLDDEVDGLSDGDELDGGIRRHTGMGLPLAGWHRGPFMALLRADLLNGVRVLNRLLNHAARVRAGTLARPRHWDMAVDVDRVDVCQVELGITGARRVYVGDGRLWLWYRGTGGGPYPCVSGLQALERFCDMAIENGVPIRVLVWLLLDGCENLAMVSLIVGLLLRHLEDTADLLDPYLAEPLIWHYEFSRVGLESSGLAADSEGLTAPERRYWSLRNAALFMVLRADDERAAELRALGESLVANARGQVESARNNPTDRGGGDDDAINQQLMEVRGWASSLDRDRYEIDEVPEGLYIQVTPPEDVSQALHDGREDLQRAQQAIQLKMRYFSNFSSQSSEPVDSEQLSDDIASARDLLENPSPLNAEHRWDAPALVAAAALEAHLLYGIEVSDDVLAFAAETVIRVGEGEAGLQPFESEQSFFEWGADRSSARVLPLLLLPAAASLRRRVDSADGSAALRRATAAGMNLARGLANEVRLYLARGIDHLWQEPCSLQPFCHHEMGLQLALESMSGCVIGEMDRETWQRTRLTLSEPVDESLANTPDASIIVSRLDAAIRALAPAVTADTCVSTRAHTLLTVVLAAQRRALLAHERNVDHRGTHTLVAARVLLLLEASGDSGPLHAYIDSYADNSELLNSLLRSISAAAEESPDLAATARRVWPGIVRRVLELNNSGHTLFQDRYFGEMALAALVPNTTPSTGFLYREVQDTPIMWWEPLQMQSEIEAWLVPAAGIPDCVDQLISFLRALTIEDQARTGLPWVAELVLADPEHIANRTYTLTEWLIEMRAVVVDAGLSAKWQQVVDALVVAGVRTLAPYSE